MKKPRLDGLKAGVGLALLLGATLLGDPAQAEDSANNLLRVFERGGARDGAGAETAGGGERRRGPGTARDQARTRGVGSYEAAPIRAARGAEASGVRGWYDRRSTRREHQS
jgi:hypothetical protein